MKIANFNYFALSDHLPQQGDLKYRGLIWYRSHKLFIKVQPINEANIAQTKT